MIQVGNTYIYFIQFQTGTNCDQGYVMVAGDRICGAFFTDQSAAANAAAVIGNYNQIKKYYQVYIFQKKYVPMFKSNTII